MPRRLGTAWWGACALAVAFALWTVLVTTGTLDGLDAALHFDGVANPSLAGEIASGIAITFWPGVVYLSLVLLGFWQRSQRLTQLSLALFLAPVLSWGGNALVKLALRRPRPASTHDHLATATGWAYPSSHMAAVTCAALLVMAVATVSRQRPRVLWAVRGLAAAAVLLVAVDRWVLAAHWVSDIVGGMLFGALAATFALAVAGVHVLDERVAGHAQSGRGKRAAIIFNPAKVGDVEGFRRRVDYALDARGWDEPIWLSTTEDDPGVAMVATALRKRVDLVLGAGGDGTINICCAGLAGTGIPFGLLPAGTTNLLARNLGIPLDEAAAIDTALDGVASRVDLLRLVPDGDQSRTKHSAVIASVGIDAEAFANTSEDLKKAVGHAAYFVAAAQQLGKDGFKAISATVTVDDGKPLHREAALVAIGNVGFIQGGIEVIPGALPDDGLLNVAVAAPDTLASWGRMLGEVLARKRDRADIDSLSGRRVVVELAEPHPWQVDGDVEDPATRLEASVLPGALTIMLPHTT